MDRRFSVATIITEQRQPRPASFDIPPAMGYKHHERLSDDFFPGEEEGSNAAVRIHLRKQLGCTGCMP